MAAGPCQSLIPPGIFLMGPKGLPGAAHANFLVNEEPGNGVRFGNRAKVFFAGDTGTQRVTIAPAFDSVAARDLRRTNPKPRNS